MFDFLNQLINGQAHPTQTQRTAPKAQPTSRPVPTSSRRVVMGADRTGMVGFHDTGFVIARPAEAYSHWLQTRTQRLHERVAGNGTNITDGLRQSVKLLQSVPPGILRRIWLLTDGYPNREEDRIYQVVEEAAQARVNINTIGFGDSYCVDLLKRISSATHNGKFMPVANLRELTEALVKTGGHNHAHRAECTVLAIDLSGSMTEPMEGRSKIQVVQEAILMLLNFKQACFS